MDKPDITIEKSPRDQTTIVWIDTPDMPEDKNGPIIRIYLNDSCLFENPFYPGPDREDLT